MRVYVERDKPNNQLYLGLGERSLRAGVVKRTQRVTDDIALDFDDRERLVGVEILDASRVLGSAALREDMVTDELVGVAEAAKLCGVRKPNFIRDFARRQSFPLPVAELASGRIWRRSDIAAFLASSRTDTTRAPYVVKQPRSGSRVAERGGRRSRRV
jgi:uncharacterized protein YuzE